MLLFTGPLKRIRNATVNENTVTLYWPKVPKDNVNYVIKYGINGSLDLLTRETNEIYKEISGLDYGKTYEFQVFHKLEGKVKPLTEIRYVSIPPRPRRKYAYFIHIYMMT